MSVMQSPVNLMVPAEIEFCERWCGTLEPAQAQMTLRHVEKGTFLGVGRAMGRSGVSPLVLVGQQLNVIDGAGYYQDASLAGQRLFPALINRALPA